MFAAPRPSGFSPVLRMPSSSSPATDAGRPKPPNRTRSRTQRSTGIWLAAALAPAATGHRCGCARGSGCTCTSPTPPCAARTRGPCVESRASARSPPRRSGIGWAAATSPSPSSPWCCPIRHPSTATRSRKPSVMPWPPAIPPASTPGRRVPDRPSTWTTPPPTFHSEKGGPPGQTGVGALGPLARREHRHKTFGHLKVRQPVPGVYFWRSRHGWVWLVTNTGTHALGRGPGADAFWQAAAPRAEPPSPTDHGSSSKPERTLRHRIDLIRPSAKAQLILRT